MFKRSPSEKRGRQPKAEDYYKILGTTMRAGQEKIKEQYIAKVKETPPETHPEEFQRLRQAYEILKDPVTRKEYDFTRKFGPKIEKKMNQALSLMAADRFSEAHDLINEVISFAPDYPQVYLAQAQLFLLEDRLESFQISFNKALETADKSQAEMLHHLKIRILMDNARPELARDELEALRKQFPRSDDRYDYLEINICTRLGDFERLWQVTTKLIPPVKESAPDHLYLFLRWLTAAVELKKKSEIGHITGRMKKIMKQIDSEEEKEDFLDYLMDEYIGYYEVGRFFEASVFLELACALDPKDQHLKILKKDLTYLVSLETSLDRLWRDFEVIPYVKMLASQYFYDEYFSFEPTGFQEEFEKCEREMGDLSEHIAFGIARVRKKFPLLYKAFQADWDDVFAKHTTNLNRESRRRIK